jgi:S1-C subfamily serine protease
MSALVVALRMHRPGDAVTLDVARDTTRQAVRVTLGERH